MNANSLPQDAIDALSAIGKMSRENEATNRGVEPWYRALMKTVTSDRIYLDPRCDNPEEAARRLFARHTGAAAHEAMSHRNARSWSLPIDDGDRPDGLSDSEIAEAGTWNPEYRHRSRSPDGAALVRREWHHDRGRGDGYAASVRLTHRAVHRALTGEDTRGCKWCEE